jgi:L-ascorbate metabolism protein UlaG (beta-lactamase superfamily)
MQITHLGHACLVVETPGARLLIDPGNFSGGFEELTDLDAILVTHQHPDHFDPERGPALIAANSMARLLVEPETAAAFEMGSDPVFAAGSNVQVGDLTISAVGGKHAINHDRVPVIGNVGFVIGALDGPRLFHPGDSYGATPDGVDVLALPTNAPWCKMSETLDFYRAVAPSTAIPIHTGLLSEVGLAMYLMHIDTFGPDGATVADLSGGAPMNVS